MRCLGVVVVVLALAGAPPAFAQDDAATIRGIITEQIDAFRADDLETAFSFASPSIRRMFGDPDRFGRMVREGYPMVWRPADVRFTDLAERDGRRIQRVIVTDGAGAPHVVDYEMIELDGSWRINGVWLRETGDAGA